MNRYHINLSWSEADGCWVADVPNLKSCSAFGDTPAEALAEVEEAIAAWLEVARESHLPIPNRATGRPSTRPGDHTSPLATRSGLPGWLYLCPHPKIHAD
jgi:predicted RNase H-like HicB family nuclease